MPVIPSEGWKEIYAACTRRPIKKMIPFKGSFLAMFAFTMEHVSLWNERWD
jgi:hypothetical protein